MRKIIPLTLLWLILFLLAGVKTSAQDIHFSQFYASPLTLNPALTGFSEGSFRLSGIYRNQWSSVTSPYITFGAGYDMRLMEGKLTNNLLGAGISVVSDKSGDGDLGMVQALLSTSYHIRLSKRHFLGLGLQGGVVQKSLRYHQLTFPKQFNGDDFDSQLPTGENFNGSSITYPDFHTGLMWYGGLTKSLDAFQGFSLYHLLSPKESFLGADNHIGRRFTAHGGLRVKLSDKTAFTPNYILMRQSKAQELNTGAAIEYNLGAPGDPTIVSLGGWYRWHDAAIATATVDFKGFRLGVSYDINVSDLTEASRYRGGFEVSLIYIGRFTPKDTGPILVPCPRL